MALTKKKIIGNSGEETAVKFLKKNKYRILKTNYTCRYGEIDVICTDKKYIIFVEVKTRKKDTLVSGVYAVNKKKQFNIFKSAHTYILENNVEKQPRFDIIEVEYDSVENSYNVREHYVNAFIQGGDYAIF